MYSYQFALTPVSYTHLDVYKRQAQTAWEGIFNLGLLQLADQTSDKEWCLHVIDSKEKFIHLKLLSSTDFLVI